MKPNPLIGKTVRALFIADDKKALKFVLNDDTELVVRADGDCCSSSWVEEIQGVEQLIGSPVVSVDDVDGVQETTNDDENFECLQFYGCKITTEKGYALIDYRNSSNGYYGGNLVWPGSDYDYFYGGVHGQNVSKEIWKPVTV